jgi:hypothetical protein
MFANYCSASDQAGNIELTQGLENLDLRKRLYIDYYKCPLCGTYYRAYYSNYNLRLVRITPVEAKLTFQKGAKDKTRYGEEYRFLKTYYKDMMKEIHLALRSSNEIAREFAGETKADQYIHLKRNEKVRELFQYPNRAVRKGVLWAFTENPREEYALAAPGRRFLSGLDKKPFIKVEVFLRSLILQLLDFDPEFRRFASSLLLYLKWNKKFLPIIARIPESQRTPELYECILERTYDLPLLTDFLSRPEKEIREITLRRIYDLCDNKETIKKMIAEIQKVKGNQSEELEYFLAHPDAGIPEYDPYD